MADSYAGFLVTLDENIRDEDAADTIKALGMVKGVLSVTPVVGRNHELSMATARVRRQITVKILDLVDDINKA